VINSVHATVRGKEEEGRKKEGRGKGRGEGRVALMRIASLVRPGGTVPGFP